jgi:tRNA pseudouridine55 synthase
MARRNQRGGFTASGLLVVDKPAGISSTGVVNQIKRLTRPGKIGHTGTLDPFATGVLVLCFNQATKLAGYFLDQDKVYEGVMFLGHATDTQDLTGQVLRRKPVASTPEEIEAAAVRFRGPIDQKPPAFSALKRDGEALYKKARRGEEVITEPRRVTIHSLEITEIELPRVHFRVHCSKGTYIRTLAHDWGAALGCGAHLEALRRTASGLFTIEQALLLGQVETTAKRNKLADRLIPPAKALDWPGAVLGAEEVAKVGHGQTLLSSELKELAPAHLKAGQLLKLTDREGRLIALAELAPNDEAQGLAVRPIKVLQA